MSKIAAKHDEPKAEERVVVSELTPDQAQQKRMETQRARNDKQLKAMKLMHRYPSVGGVYHVRDGIPVAVDGPAASEPFKAEAKAAFHPVE